MSTGTSTKRAATPEDWRREVLAFADRCYQRGHAAEDRGEWYEADVYRDTYSHLCSMVAQLDPRPGGGNAPARPW